MRKEVKIKSIVPIYGTAGVWLVYCLFFPLYKLTHFAILIVLGIAAYIILSQIFRGKTIYVEEPVTTGNAEIDALLAEGTKAVTEMTRLRDSIRDEKVKSKTGEIIKITDQIYKDLLHDPNDYRQVKHFADFYLPTTIKLLQTYDRMGELGTADGNFAGQNITGTIQRIEAILDMTLEGYQKQLDALFANQALDIETDITVLKTMLKKEGLAGRDF
jgi:5-bromo-4-chloroindolyl phosphate hydrolysis protein